MFRESTHRSLTKVQFALLSTASLHIALCCCWFVKQRFYNGQGQRVSNDFRGPGFPSFEWFGSSPAPFPSRPLPFSRQQVSLFLSLPVCRLSSFPTGRRGEELRWASTLANRSNARHRSNFRTPPPPHVCSQSLGICVARRGRKRFIASWSQDVTYLSLHSMPPPPPGRKGPR